MDNSVVLPNGLVLDLILNSIKYIEKSGECRQTFITTQVQPVTLRPSVIIMLLQFIEKDQTPAIRSYIESLRTQILDVDSKFQDTKQPSDLSGKEADESSLFSESYDERN